MAETKKYVRIKKASIEGAWYADKLGKQCTFNCDE